MWTCCFWIPSWSVDGHIFFMVISQSLLLYRISLQVNVLIGQNESQGNRTYTLQSRLIHVYSFQQIKSKGFQREIGIYNPMPCFVPLYFCEFVCIWLLTSVGYQWWIMDCNKTYKGYRKVIYWLQSVHWRHKVQALAINMDLLMVIAQKYIHRSAFWDFHCHGCIP